MTYPITCLVCGKEGTTDMVGNGPGRPQGWYLAASRIGGYTCSKDCDKVILDYDVARHQEREAAKKAKKVASKKIDRRFLFSIY